VDFNVFPLLPEWRDRYIAEWVAESESEGASQDELESLRIELAQRSDEEWAVEFLDPGPPWDTVGLDYRGSQSSANPHMAEIERFYSCERSSSYEERMRRLCAFQRNFLVHDLIELGEEQYYRWQDELDTEGLLPPTFVSAFNCGTQILDYDWRTLKKLDQVLQRIAAQFQD